MSHFSALPFTLSRSDSIVGEEIISTTERVHGLLRLDGERLVIQWRVSRATQRVGSQIRTDRQLESVREVVIPLSALAGAAVRWVWWRWPPGRYLVLSGGIASSGEWRGRERGVVAPDALQPYHNAGFAAATIPDARLVPFERGGNLLMSVEQSTIRTIRQEHILEHASQPVPPRP